MTEQVRLQREQFNQEKDKYREQINMEREQLKMEREWLNQEKDKINEHNRKQHANEDELFSDFVAGILPRVDTTQKPLIKFKIHQLLFDAERDNLSVKKFFYAFKTKCVSVCNLILFSCF